MTARLPRIDRLEVDADGTPRRADGDPAAPSLVTFAECWESISSLPRGLLTAILRSWM